MSQQQKNMLSATEHECPLIDTIIKQTQNLLHVWAATSEQVFISRLSLSPILTATVTKSTRASSSTVWFSSTSRCSRTCTDDCQFLPTAREPCDNKLRIKQSKEVCLQSLAVSYSFDLKYSSEKLCWVTHHKACSSAFLTILISVSKARHQQRRSDNILSYFGTKKKCFRYQKKPNSQDIQSAGKVWKVSPDFFFVFGNTENCHCLQSLLFKDKTNIQRNIFTLQFTQVTLIQQKITLEKVIFLKEATFVPN